MDVVSALKACALFREFTDTGLQIIAGSCTPKTYPQGTTIFAENMVADSLLVLAQGRVKLSAKNRNNEEVDLGHLDAGDYLGELSLIQQGTRLCTAVASSPVVALELRHGDFQKLLGTKPQACMKLLMGVVAAFGQKVLDNRESLKSLLTKT